MARLRGLGVPHTITHVRDDAHAIEIATSAQCGQAALYPRNNDRNLHAHFATRAFPIAPSLMRWVSGDRRSIGTCSANCASRTESVSESEIVPNGTMPDVTTEPPEHQDLTLLRLSHAEIVPNGTMPNIEHAEQDVEAPPANQPKRISGQRWGTYPSASGQTEPRRRPHPPIDNWLK